MSDTTSSSEARPSWLRLLVIALCVIAIDQSTKFYAVKTLTFVFERSHAVSLGQQVRAFVTARHLMGEVKAPYYQEVIPHFWANRYAENPGAAWSIFANAPDSIRIPFFHFVSLLAIVLIGLYYARLQPNQRLLGVALSLVMGGAIGNLIDRVVRSYVIDFIDWHLNDAEWHTHWHWPTFNIADTGISVGVALIALDALLVWRASKTQPQSVAANT
jgi:signal peptidase II